MRHNPAAGSVVIMLRSLKMHGMAQAVGELTEQGSPAFEAALPILSQLLKAETADREVRSTAYQLKAARFPNYRDLAGFDFASSEVNEALARQLHRCEFLEDAHNVVLVGGPGTGKTHLATAIGVQAIEHRSKDCRRVFSWARSGRTGAAKGIASMSAAAQTRRANAMAGSLTLNLMRLRTFIALFAVILYFSFAAPNFLSTENLGILSDGLVMMGVSEFWQMVIKGVVIIAAVVVDQAQRKLQQRVALQQMAQLG
jgi:hypothetical protein